MNILKVDAKRRIRIPEIAAEQLYSWEKDGDGRFILTRVMVETRDAFPPGSLTKYVTPARNKEQLVLLEGCTLEARE